MAKKDWSWERDRMGTKRLRIEIFTPFSHTWLLYLCFASQMSLLEFYHDSSLYLPMTSIHGGACGGWHCERECTRWGYPRG